MVSGTLPYLYIFFLLSRHGLYLLLSSWQKHRGALSPGSLAPGTVDAQDRFAQVPQGFLGYAWLLFLSQAPTHCLSSSHWPWHHFHRTQGIATSPRQWTQSNLLTAERRTKNVCGRGSPMHWNRMWSYRQGYNRGNRFHASRNIQSNSRVSNLQHTYAPRQLWMWPDTSVY